MKYTPLLAAMLLATSASAEVVTATGWGVSFDGALANAKQEALEMGASTFVTGKKLYQNRQLSEEIVQYNGGIIKEYDIIRSIKMGDEYSVTIKADVVEQDNRRHANENGAVVDFTEYDKRANVVDHLDDPGQAIHMKVMDHKVTVRADGVHVKMRIRLDWQPKWLSDVKSFSTVIGEKGRTSSNTQDEIVGNISNMLLNVNPLAGVAFHTALDPDEVENIESQMICFATDNKSNNVDCRNIGVDFQRFSADPKLVIVAGGQVIHQKYIYTNMFEKVYPGEYKQNRFLRNHKVTFHQPALVVYTEEVQDVYLDFVVPRHQLEGVKSVEVFLR